MIILAETAAKGGNWLQDNIFWWVIIAWLVIIYFLLIAPQRKKEKKRQQMLKSLEKNDRIVTSGGVYGVVKNITESKVTLLVDEKRDVHLTIDRSVVYAILNREGEPGELPSKDRETDREKEKDKDRGEQRGKE
jgi:preprotein translocase subunit YajC